MTDTKDWPAHLAAIEAEGISTQAYARREGVSAGTLYYWRRRLKLAVQPSSTVSLVPVHLREETAALRCTVWLAPAQILTQRTKDKNKLYALHAPEVECIAKVRREVANIIVSPTHKVGDETGRSVGRSLPVHALLATACEATGTTCRTFGSRQPSREGGVICQHHGGWDARLSGMVNRSELLQASLCITSQRC